jgi:hypothetical protein
MQVGFTCRVTKIRFATIVQDIVNKVFVGLAENA